MKHFTLAIEVHDKGIAKYLVHGLHDVLWTDSIDEALDALREDLENLNTKLEPPKWPEGPHMISETDIKPIRGEIK